MERERDVSTIAQALVSLYAVRQSGGKAAKRRRPAVDEALSEAELKRKKARLESQRAWVLRCVALAAGVFAAGNGLNAVGKRSWTARPWRERSAAAVARGDSGGATTPTGRSIRAATDEPPEHPETPDLASADDAPVRPAEEDEPRRPETPDLASTDELPVRPAEEDEPQRPETPAGPTLQPEAPGDCLTVEEAAALVASFGWDLYAECGLHVIYYNPSDDDALIDTELAAFAAMRANLDFAPLPPTPANEIGDEVDMYLGEL